jgi:putative effector of murein hydrolase
MKHYMNIFIFTILFLSMIIFMVFIWYLSLSGNEYIYGKNFLKELFHLCVVLKDQMLLLFMWN